MSQTTASSPGYFFIIGAMKAGTTSLYKYLSGHPDLYASPRKEPRVFRDPADPGTLRSSFLALFEGRQHEAWCFEGSTAYTKHPEFSGVPQRLKAVVPDARFVYLVRSPVERTWSQYVHNLAHGRETRSFADALREDPQYLDVSRYHLQLTQYLDVFARDRIQINVFEEMVEDPVATVRQVCRFLGVDASYAPAAADVAYNTSAQKRAASRPLSVARALGVDGMVPWRVRRRWREQGAQLPKRSELTPDLRARVADALREDTEAFFSVFGRRLTSWSDFA